eukprot:jgi/Tetstr1/465221/TSEL_009927.t1
MHRPAGQDAQFPPWRAGPRIRPASGPSVSGRGQARTQPAQPVTAPSFVEEDWSSYTEEDWAALAAAERGCAAAVATEAMLEWPALCRLVSGFAQTSKGRDDLRSMRPPPTQAESERLAAETRAADVLESEYAIQLNFGGVNTLEAHTALMRASRGGMLTGTMLRAVAQTINVGQRLRRQVQAASWDEEVRENGVMRLLRAVNDIVPQEALAKAIIAATSDSGHLRDSASPELERARQRVASLEGRVKGILKGYPGEAILHNGRWCVAVSDPSTIAAKALVVGSSSGGAVTYIEPQAAVPINNDIAQAMGLASAAEEAALWKLTGEVMEVEQEVSAALATVCWLDAITAKARFGNWMGGTLATLVPFPKTGRDRRANKRSQAADAGADGADGEDDAARWLLDLRQLRHPLLMAKYMKALKKSGRSSGGGRQAPARSLSSARQRLLRNSMVAKSLIGDKARSSALASEVGAAGSGAEGDAGEEEEEELREPVASDLRIRKETRALVITGPNTGGKTLTLKALGLAVLMARCGVPVAAAHPARLPCFDSVLADIGDEQSLSASLSTFSGHLKRIQGLRKESTSKSLVLLDEVGTGTDPGEGTALGISLLRALVRGGPGGAAFTMATTHMGALTSLKYSDGVFENACVEFNEEALRPTYRLLLGVPGKSNALNIAARLGLDAGVVEAARARMGAGAAEVDSAISRLERLKAVAQADGQAAAALEGRMARLAVEFKRLSKTTAEKEAELALREAEELNKLLRRVRSSVDANESKRQQQEQGRKGGAAGPKTSGKGSKTALQSSAASADWAPKVGELVHVPKLKKNVTVAAISGDQLQLNMGLLKVSVNVTEVRPM